jgi:hypothetical protein
MKLESLPNKTLLRDLATDIAPPDERLSRFQPWSPRPRTP